MKLLGVMLILCAGTLCGGAAARSLSAYPARLRLLRQMVTAMITELRGTLPLTADLIRQTAAIPDFAPLCFLQAAARNAEQFPYCWRDAVRNDRSLTPEERAVLLTVGDTLGSSTLDGQVAALDLCLERLSEVQSAAEIRCGKKAPVCRSIGILGALFFSILLL